MFRLKAIINQTFVYEKFKSLKFIEYPKSLHPIMPKDIARNRNHLSLAKNKKRHQKNRNKASGQQKKIFLVSNQATKHAKHLESNRVAKVRKETSAKDRERIQLEKKERLKTKLKTIEQLPSQLAI
jgi:hypothetical protein